VRCDTVVRHEGAYPAFDCDGFSTGTGTSGGPWLTRAVAGQGRAPYPIRRRRAANAGADRQLR